MNREALEKCIRQLDAIIATLKQAAVIGGHSVKETQALELLKAARLRLVEEIEARTGHTY